MWYASENSLMKLRSSTNIIAVNRANNDALSAMGKVLLFAKLEKYAVKWLLAQNKLCCYS